MSFEAFFGFFVRIDCHTSVGVLGVTTDTQTALWEKAIYFRQMQTLWIHKNLSGKIHKFDR